MSSDIRISTSLFDNIKIKKLERKLGPSAVLSLIRLWTYAGVNRTKGVLHDMDHDDIEIAANWDGERGALIAALYELRLLIDDKDGITTLNDWPEHNGFVFYKEERTAQAKKAAASRWDKRENKNSNATRMQTACDQHANSNAPYPYPTPTPTPTPTPAPSPSPSPSPSQNILSGANAPDTDGPPKEKNKRREKREAAIRILGFLNEKTGRDFRAVDANLRLVMARLSEYTESEIRKIIARKCREWEKDERMSPYLRPKTLFAASNMASYIAELGT